MLWGRALSGDAGPGGAVYTVGGDLLGVDARTGRALWPPVPVLSDQVPAVAGDLVFVRHQSGDVIGVDARSGQITWRCVRGEVRPGDPDLTAADGVVYAIADGSILAYDRRPPAAGR